MKSIQKRGIIFLAAVFFTTFFIGGSTQLTMVDENYNFYLSNYTTFAPGDIVKINLYSYSQSSRKFVFKLLKIEDPIRFFTLLDQNNSRYAFDIWGKDKSLLLKYTKFIKEWEFRPAGRDNYNSSDVNVGKIDEPGIYIVQALRNDLVGYCAIVVTDYAMIYKNNQKEILTFIADAKSGSFIKNARFDFYQNGKSLGSKTSDKDGLLYVNLSDFKGIQNSNFQIFGFTGDEIIINDPYLYFNRESTEYLTAYIYTQQPVYRPGQEINFKAIFRNKKGNETLNSPDLKFDVSVKSPKNKEVYSDQLTTNDFGSLSGSFVLDDEADLGYYSIIFTKDGRSYYGSFTVEEYKKPEYKVNVVSDRNQYANGDSIKAVISADYYFGSPVKNAKVQVNVYRQNYWRPWWYWSEWSWFYRGFYKGSIYHGNQDLIYQDEGELDDSGKFHFSYKVDSDKNYDYQYIISAQVTDASRSAISGSATVFVTRGSFTLSTSPEKYFYQSDEEVKIKVNAVDFSDRPVKTAFKLIVNYPNHSRDKKDVVLSDTLLGKTDEKGSAVISYRPYKSRTGYFNYSVIAYDEKGREINAGSSFYIGDVNDYYYQRTGAGLEILTDKDAYEKGDSLIAYVFLPDNNQELLLTYETDRILFYKKLKPQNNSFEIREKLTDKYSPSFNISVSFVKDRMLYQTTKLVGVLAKDKFLNISLKPSKEIYKPGEQADYEIIVKDYLGNPVKNTEVSFGIVDESIYAIKEDETQPIETFFYSPQYSYLPTYNSLQAGNFSSYSRPATYIDKNYFSYKEDDIKHKGKLFGKISIQDDEKVPDGLFIILTGERNYYTGKIDSSGRYRIENIAKGDYQIFISVGSGKMLPLDEVKVDGEKQFDFIIKDNLKQEINELLTQGIVSDQEREQPVFFRSQDAAPMTNAIRMSETKMMKTESREKSDYVKADVRTNFVDALIWKAHIVTDKNGKAKVEFKIPDNLTTWRTTVKGITKNTDVGQKVNKFISRKNLLVRMETPRFFRQDDEIVISTIVHNYLSSAKTTKIEFTSDNLKLLGSKINSEKSSDSDFSSRKFYEVKIPANDELRIDWKCKVNYPNGDATLKASALTNEESDAMEVKVPIIPNGVKIINPLVADYSDKNIKDKIEFEIPADVDLRTADLSFTLNPSLAGTILKSLDDLAGYPYGCVEQTMSRFLPTLIVESTFKEINVPLKSKTIEELPKYIDAGLKRLYDFQHSDGGWGWWTNDQTHPYMTAYVVYGMSLARNAGYKIDNNVFTNGVNNLKHQIENVKPDLDETTLAYMIYALSTAVKNQDFNKSVTNELIDVLLKKDLKSYPLSLVAIALKNFDENKKAKDLLERLKKQVNEEKSFAFWGGQEWHYRWQNDNVQGTAFAIKAILNIEGNSDLISKAVNWLLKNKRGYSWRSTQETATVLFALTDYLKVTKELDSDYSVTVFVNDKKIAEKNFSSADVYKENQAIKISSSDLKKGKNIIRIEKSGKGKLYFSGISEYFTENLSDLKNDNGFKIKREYYVLDTGIRDDKIIYYKKLFKGTVKSGQDVFVKTTVESKSDNLDYFILEDMLPSGFEVVKDMDKYFIDGENDYQNNYYNDFIPWRWHYADREYRDEKVAFFVTSCQSKMEFSYIIKAQIPGDYKIMPAQGYLMYYPELNGFSDVVNIRVNDVR